MSLIHKPEMTEENRAAHQHNGRQSRGAATTEGKERTRAANLRHGFYSQARGEALRALGEDPAELRALIEDARASWRPADGFQARIAERLGRLQWRMDRAERMQESLAARLMQQRQKRRQLKATGLRERMTPRIDIMESLATNAADPRYYTPREYFKVFREAFGMEGEGVEKDILLLMHRLRKPEGPVAEASGSRRGRPGKTACREDEVVPPLDPSPNVVAAGEREEDDYLRELAAWDESDLPIPWPEIPVAKGAERDRLREELVDLAKMNLESLREVLNSELKAYEDPWSQIEQDELQAAPHPHAELMRREEESCFRQFMHLGSLLMKIQNHAEKQVSGARCQVLGDEKQVAGDRLQGTGDGHPAVAPSPSGTTHQAGQNEGASGDVDENTDGQVSGASYQVPEGKEPVERNGLQAPGGEVMAAAAGGSVRGSAQNEGASGDVDENIDPGRMGPRPFCPASGQWGLATPDKLT